MKAHFAMMARYNAWANARLYRMAGQLSDEQYRRDVGTYFKSLHGTLNHILAADLIWMHRLTGEGDYPGKLSATLCEELAALTAKRRHTDERIVSFVQGVTDVQLEEMRDYQTLNGTPQRQRLRDILAHVFNHQTHHRGHAHSVLTILGVTEPEPLDLLIMQREDV